MNCAFTSLKKSTTFNPFMTGLLLWFCTLANILPKKSKIQEIFRETYWVILILIVFFPNFFFIRIVLAIFADIFSTTRGHCV